MGYQDVRGPDGRLLFRLDAARAVIEIVLRGKTYYVDLAPYLATVAAIVEIEPLDFNSPGEPETPYNAFGG